MDPQAARGVRRDTNVLVAERGRSGAFFKQITMTGSLWTLEQLAAKVVERFRLTHVIAGFYTAEGEAVHAPGTLRQQRRVFFTVSTTQMVRGRRVMMHGLQDHHHHHHHHHHNTPPHRSPNAVASRPLRLSGGGGQPGSAVPGPSPPRAPGAAPSSAQRKRGRANGGRSPSAPLRHTLPSRSAATAGHSPVRSKSVSPSYGGVSTGTGVGLMFASLPVPPSPPPRSTSPDTEARAMRRSPSGGGSVAARRSRSAATTDFSVPGTGAMSMVRIQHTPLFSSLTRCNTHDGLMRRTLSPTVAARSKSPGSKDKDGSSTRHRSPAPSKDSRRHHLLTSDTNVRLCYDEYISERIVQKHLKTLPGAPPTTRANFQHQYYPATVAWEDYGESAVWATLDRAPGEPREHDEPVRVAIVEDEDALARGHQQWRNRNRTLPGDRVMVAVDPETLRGREVAALPMPGSPQGHAKQQQRQASPTPASSSAPPQRRRSSSAGRRLSGPLLRTSPPGYPVHVHAAKVVGMLERAPVRQLFAVFEEGALKTPGLASYATLTPMSKAYPKLYVPLQQLSGYHEEDRNVFAVTVEDWPAASMYPHARINALLGSLMFDDHVAIEEKMALVELGRLRPNPATLGLDVDDRDVSFSTALANIAELKTTLEDDVAAGRLVDLRDTTSVFTINASASPKVAFSCQPVESGAGAQERPGRYRVGVHIVDVGALIPPTDVLDELLRARLSTVVLPHRLEQLFPAAVRAEIGMAPGTTNRCFTVMWEDGAGGKPSNIFVGQAAVHIRCNIGAADVRACANTGRTSMDAAAASDAVRVTCPIYGRAERDNAVTLARDVSAFAQVMEAIGEEHSPPSTCPHFQFTNLWANCGLRAAADTPALQNSPAHGADKLPKVSPALMSRRSSLDNGFDGLLDALRDASRCDTPYDAFLCRTAEHAANRMVMHYFAETRFPSRILPCVCTLVQKGTQITEGAGLAAYSLYDESTTPPTAVHVGKIRPPSCGALEPYVRDWVVAGDDAERLMDITSPLDRYISVVSLRMLAILLRQLKEETRNRVVFADKELVHTNSQGTITLPARDICIHQPTTELGIGRWRPSTILPLIKSDAAHAVLRHCAYERFFDLMKRHCVDYADLTTIRVPAVLVGANLKTGEVGLRIADWGLTKWEVPRTAEPCEVTLSGGGDTAPSLLFVIHNPRPAAERPVDADDGGDVAAKIKKDAKERRRERRASRTHETARVGDRVCLVFTSVASADGTMEMRVYPPSHLSEPSDSPQRVTA